MSTCRGREVLLLSRDFLLTHSLTKSLYQCRQLPSCCPACDPRTAPNQMTSSSGQHRYDNNNKASMTAAHLSFVPVSSWLVPSPSAHPLLLSRTALERFKKNSYPLESRTTESLNGWRVDKPPHSRLYLCRILSSIGRSTSFIRILITMALYTTYHR